MIKNFFSRFLNPWGKKKQQLNTHNWKQEEALFTFVLQISQEGVGTVWSQKNCHNVSLAKKNETLFFTNPVSINILTSSNHINTWGKSLQLSKWEPMLFSLEFIYSLYTFLGCLLSAHGLSQESRSHRDHIVPKRRKEHWAEDKLGWN